MHIEYAIQLDMPRLKRMKRAAVGAAPWRRYVALPCAVVAGMGLGLYLAAIDIPYGWALFAILGLMALSLWISVQPAIVFQQRASVAAAEPALVTITDTELIIATSVQRSSVLWSGIASVTDREGIWVCRSAGSVARFVIYREYLSTEQLGELQMFLAGRGLVPQAYKIKI